MVEEDESPGRPSSEREDESGWGLPEEEANLSGCTAELIGDLD